MIFSRKNIFLPLFCLLWLTGCAHYPLNEALDPAASQNGYRFNEDLAEGNTHSLFICLALSGGGTRAAALSYGVLKKLRDTKIVWKGQERRLLDEVDCISSVSGGSFTAAYYGLFGERVFDDFRAQFLDVNIQGTLIRRALWPNNLARLASPTFGRIDIAAEYYDKHVYGEKSFADLAQGKGPFIIINATNLANGERFEFTQDQFDFLVSNLSSYPIARAVAASSAFPFLLSPLSLKNYPHGPDFKLPQDYALGLGDYDDNRRRYYWARNRAMYADDNALPYLHLMDGGLADNIGLRAIETAYRRSSGFIRKLINEGEIEKFVIIVVNAGTQAEDAISKKESPPGFGVVFEKTATIAMDNFSKESVEEIKELSKARKQTQRTLASCQKKLDACPNVPPLPRFAKAIDPYVIEIKFEALRDPVRRQRFLNLPTNFSLPKEDIEALIGVGPELLDGSSDYQAFIRGLHSP